MADYRPDMYDRVEGPYGTPRSVVDRALAVECPDCRVNVFIEFSNEHDPADPAGYSFRIAHDATCPTLRRIEEGDG